MINHKIEEKFIILNDCIKRLESKYNNNVEWIRANFEHYERNKRVYLKEAKLNENNTECKKKSNKNKNSKKGGERKAKSKKNVNKRKRKYRNKKKKANEFDEVQEILDNIRDMDQESESNIAESLQSSCFISSNDSIVIKPIAGNNDNNSNKSNKNNINERNNTSNNGKQNLKIVILILN